jgi:hypothetical protein
MPIFEHRQTPKTMNNGTRRPRRYRTPGFALVVALSLMGFIFLLVVSLATSARLEMAASGTQRTATLARENARLGLLTALAHLQRSAGPDERATARADILGSADPVNRYWTGVWATTDGTLQTWLVSGNASPQHALDFTPAVEPDNAVVLLGSEGDASAVEAPLVSIESAAGEQLGHYAYWISDEGIKARINLDQTSWNSTDAAVVQSGRQVSERFGIEAMDVWHPLADYLGDSGWGHALGQLVSESQLPLVFQSWSAGDASAIDWQAHSHDVTLVSNSLAVDASGGGLKLDLSRILDPGFNTPGFGDADALIEDADAPMLTWGALRSFANPWATWAQAQASYPQLAPRAPRSDQAGHFPIPVLVQMGWGAIRSGTGPGSTLLLTMKPVVVLVNPYDTALAPASYQLVWTPDEGRGLVMITFDPEPRPAAAEFQEGVNTRPTEFYPKNLLGEYPTLTIRAAGFEPGEIKVFSPIETGEYPEPGENGIELGSQYPSAAYSWKDTRRELGSYTRSADGKVTLQISGGKMTVDYRMQEGAAWASLQSIQEIGIGMSPSASQVGNAGQPKIQVSLEPESSGALPPSINLIRRRLVMRSSASSYVSDNYTGSGLRWLADFNPRAYGSNARPPEWSSHPLWMADAGNTNNHLPVGADWFVDYELTTEGTPRGFWGPSTDASGESVTTLFSVPRTPVLSLGFLQHAPMGLRVWDPAYPFANSYASPFVPLEDKDIGYELNEAFWDRYFFSGLHRDEVTGEWEALNPRIKRLDDADDTLVDNYQGAAAAVMIEGGFNINSTSLEAWKAFLSNFSGQDIDYYHTQTGQRSQVRLGNSFFRTLNPNDSGAVDWSGYHTLTDQQVERLAAQIVYRIRERGAPFTSLQAFVNRPLGELSGLLQEAIDSDETVSVDGVEYPPTGINDSLKTPRVSTYDAATVSSPSAGLGARSTAAPGWLTQADILTAVAPLIQVRSDTFIIRAYGNTTDPISGEVVAEARCEAVVQRVPRPLNPAGTDPSSPDYYTVADDFGRAFTIIHFKWLN